MLDIWPEILLDLNIIKNNFLLKILDNIINFIYKKSNLIFVQSESFKKIIQKKIKNKKIYVLNSWSDDISFNNRKNKINKNSILYLGNIGYSQNFEILIR